MVEEEKILILSHLVRSFKEEIFVLEESLVLKNERQFLTVRENLNLLNKKIKETINSLKQVSFTK